MFLTRLVINQYGPVRDLQMELGPGIQIIWGPNEAGKTLTIDAMVKLMLGKTVKDFEDIDRIDQSPEGYLLIENSQKEQIKVDSTKSLSQHMGLSPRDVRNILVIRNSDLTINLEEEYYRTVTDRLTGLQTKRIEALVSMFRQYGRVTEGGRLSNSQEFGKIEDQRKKAEELRDSLSSYRAEAEQEKLGDLELEKIKLTRQLSQSKEDIARIEKQLAFADYHKVEQNLSKLHEIVDKYKDYEKIEQADYNRLVELKTEINAARSRIESNSKESDGLDKAINDLKGRKAEIEGKIKPFQDKESVVEQLRQDLVQLQQQDSSSPGLWLMVAAFVLLALAGLIIIPLVLNQNLIYLWLCLLFTALFLVLFILYISQILRYRRYTGRVKKLLYRFNNLGIKADSLEQAGLSAGSFFDRKKSLEESRIQLEQELEIDNRQKQRIAEEIKRDRELIAGNGQKISDILSRLAIKDETELGERLETKKEIIYQIKQLFEGLAHELGLDYSGENKVEEIRDKLKMLDQLAADRRPQDYSPDKLKKNVSREAHQKEKQRELDLEERLKEIEDQLYDHQIEMKTFQTDLVGLDIGQDIQLDNLAKIAKAEAFLEEFVKDIDHRFEVAMEAISILEQISSEEQLKVANIFDTLSASDYFKQITDNRYQSIYYDSGLKRVKVVDSEDRALDAAQLSRGTYDQLYLAIRVALAKKVMDEPAFFILDDAFIYSDTERLKQQFEVLGKLAEEGWSFLYFTAKEEVKDIGGQFSNHKLISMEDKK